MKIYNKKKFADGCFFLVLGAALAGAMIWKREIDGKSVVLALIALVIGADALVRSGGNWLMFFTRMNIIAWGRFTVLVLKEICLRAGIQAPLQKQLDAYKKITASLQTYMEQLKRIDLAAFQKETAQYQPLESYIDCIEDEKSLNFFLKKNMVELGISIPWEGDFDTFMRDKSRHLIYE